MQPNQKTESILNWATKGLSWRLRAAFVNVESFADIIRLFPYLVTRRLNLGSCSICERRTLFVKENEWLRDHYRCVRCRSIPRWRAVIHVLNLTFPCWRELRILESSPGGASSEKLRRECKQYVPTHFFSDIEPGCFKDGIRCENLERMTFDDEAFDLAVTQDVFEHVLKPDKAFKDIARVLKAGGAHVFTVPFHASKKTVVRAVATANGIKYVEEKVYHGNPIDSQGSLVVTDWGYDLPDFIKINSGLTTTVYLYRDPKLGLDGDLLEVFVSRKAKKSEE